MEAAAVEHPFGVAGDGDAEVGEVDVGLRVPVEGQQDVPGLDVAVEEAGGMGGVHRAGRLPDDP